MTYLQLKMKREELRNKVKEAYSKWEMPDEEIFMEYQEKTLQLNQVELKLLKPLNQSEQTSDASKIHPNCRYTLIVHDTYLIMIPRTKVHKISKCKWITE